MIPTSSDASVKPFGNFEPLKYYEDKRPVEVPAGCIKSAVFTVVGMVDRDTIPKMEIRKMVIDHAGNLTWWRTADGEARCNENHECRSYYNYWKQTLEAQYSISQR